MVPGSGRCSFHPDRAGLGLCVECRKVICSECTTQFEGINRCARCLSARLAAASRLAERRDWSPSGVALGLVALGLLYGSFYGLATIASH